jgi:hypothetical protein
MPSDQTPRDFTVFEINQVRKDIAQPRDLTADRLIAACAARAQLAVAAALLDVADAIRSSAPGPDVTRALGGIATAVKNLGGP